MIAAHGFEKGTNRIETFNVLGRRVGSAQPHASIGTVPYGFDFDERGTLVVSEAATGLLRRTALPRRSNR